MPFQYYNDIQVTTAYSASNNRQAVATVDTTAVLNTVIGPLFWPEHIEQIMTNRGGAKGSIVIDRGTMRNIFTNLSPQSVHVDVYMTLARKSMFAGDNADNPDDNRYSPGVCFRYGFADQQIDASNVLYRNVGWTPYMNQSFVQRFKIIKKKTFVLSPGQAKWITVTRRNQLFKESDYLEAGISANKMQIANRSIDMLIIVRGMAVLTGGTFSTDATGLPQFAVTVAREFSYKWRDTVGTGALATQPNVTQLSYPYTYGGALAGIPNYPFAATSNNQSMNIHA